MSDSINDRDEIAAHFSSAEDLAVSITVEHSDRVNFGMQQNGVPLVHEVAITNDGSEPLHDLSIRVSLDNGECEPWVWRIARIDPAATCRVEPDGLSLDAQALATRTEAERTHLRVEVCCEAGSRSRTFPVDLLAFDHWPGVGHGPEMTAAFVTPNHPRVAELLRAARKAMGTLSEHDALDGYQSGSRQQVGWIAEACFSAAATRELGYINPPASFEHDGQRVRLVDRLCREGLGTCLDLTLLLAALWEQCGLHPLVLLLEGHAIPALWTHEAHLPEPAIDEPARIRNLIELGEIVPVESTLLTQRGASFGAAVAAAKRRLHSPGASFCAIDIRSCRKRGIRPLPLRDSGDVSSLDLHAVRDTPELTPANTTLDRLALAERADQRQVTAAGNDDADPASRIERWQTRLLDLSLRNRLINFRESGRTLRLSVPDVASLEDALAAGDAFSIYPKTDGDESFLRQELDARHLYAAQTPAEVQKRLLTLYRTARSSIEETGANLLHLAIGMLKWYEAESSDTPRYAPIILLPVQLQRSASGSGYRYDLSLSEEPLRPNVTLLEKLRTEFGLDTQALHGLPEDENGLDIPLILHSFRAAIRESPRWEVEETAHLGLFSFNKFLMWRDLRENLDRLKQNRLVAHLMDRAGDDFDPEPFPQPEDLDRQVQPGELFCTRDADSTQLAAVRAVSQDKTFVLEGPPGTGKSQTIANIIADSLARGKRVLFVAEKMAALSVVSRRLEEDGLGPFCLELHSAKASKKEVLTQLESALQAATAQPPADWQGLCEMLRLTRDQLNSYVHELHQPRPTGETLYRVLGRLSLLGEGPRIALPTLPGAETSQKQLETWRKAVAEVRERSSMIDPPSDHPLRGVGQAQWRFDLPAQARQAIENAGTAINALASSLGAFSEAGRIELPVDELTRPGVQAVAALAYQLRKLSGPMPGRDLLVGDGAAALHQQIQQVVQRGRRHDEEQAALLGRYREEFLELDHLVHLDALTRAQRKPGPLRLIAGQLARRKLRPWVLAELPGIEALQADLETARRLKRESAALADMPDMAGALGALWNNGQTDWAAVEQLLDRCAKLRIALEVLRQDPAAAALVTHFAKVAIDGDRLRNAQVVAIDLIHAWNTWSKTWEQLKRVLRTSGKEAFGPAADTWLPKARQTFNRWLGGLGELDQWCTWRLVRDTAIEVGLSDLIDGYESGRLTRKQLADAFERSFAEQWFNATANRIEAIRGFNVEAHHAAIERFRRIDQELIGHTRHVIAARLAHPTPLNGGPVSGQSELGILRRELQKKRRHLPTRRLIEAMPNLLARLKPCFLMSPLSVAQYLDARLPPFDLVIFDEASQIPVWDAIGAIARGTNVIVVGDSKQLPPTSFFDTVDAEDEAAAEDLAVDDMESILKECNASGVPGMQLRWHYRSRHESLIAFSNHHYYENALHTFPSPQERSAELGVTLRHVAHGVYDRGGSRTNRVEAGQVVQEVVRLLRSVASSDSIGIVTFNQAQQSLIEDLLDAACREHPEIERFFTQEVEEPVFVKNLENVQGDERDTIIFSVGYGPDQTGRPSMNFGPLNKEGGERRLNVAVTRARRRLIVFSSLRADQIDLRRTRAVGVRHFKTFLDYASRGPQAIAEAVEHSGTREFDSGFEKAVWKALTARGWDVDTQVGCAGYRVDLAVRDRERPGRYLLGIECDGAAYHSAKTARDRDRLRQSVLEGLGWQIERIWSTEWRVNPERCLGRIEQALEMARQHEAAVSIATSPEESGFSNGETAAVKPPAAEPSESSADSTATKPPAPATQAPATLYASSPPRAVSAQSLAASPLPVYIPAALPSPGLPRLDIFEDQAFRPAVEALGYIVKVEGPVVEEQALRRLAEWFGVQRVTTRFRDRFAEIQESARATQPLRLSGGTFWPASLHEADFTIVRIPSEDPATRRDLAHIPLAERVNAVLYILQTQYGLPLEELQREVARLFGVQRMTARLAEVVAESISETVKRGLARHENDHVSLV